VSNIVSRLARDLRQLVAGRACAHGEDGRRGLWGL